MQIHRIKLNHHYADAVLNGDKTFEIRYNDRGYQTCDTVIFTVIDDLKISMNHPLNGREYVITYLVHGYGLEKDWCVFSIKSKEKET